jgi:hypothetical protein
MIKIFCDPIHQTIQAINELYPDLECIIQYDPGINPNEYKGVTCFPEDGSIPVIDISPIIPYMAVVEILCHEVSHVVVGVLPKGEDDHGKKWQDVMQKIEDKYNEIGFREMGDCEIRIPDLTGGIVKFGWGRVEEMKEVENG